MVARRKCGNDLGLKRHFSGRPWVEGLTFADEIDFLRGVWDEEKSALVLTFRRWRDPSRKHSVIVHTLPLASGLFS